MTTAYVIMDLCRISLFKHIYVNVQFIVNISFKELYYSNIGQVVF